MRALRVCSLSVLAVLAGCPDRSIGQLTPAPSSVLSKDIPVSADLDILFVIDNSPSTRDKQAVFAANYVNFVAKLESFPTRPNMHLGVVTTSVSIADGSLGGSQCHAGNKQDGLLQNSALDPLETCAPPTDDRFLSDLTKADGSRQTNYNGTLAEALSCISHVGEAGCGFEAPLEAMKRALDGTRPENQGFVRDGAYLAVVILTDEDDCSGDPRLFANGTGGDDFRCTQPAYRCDQGISATSPATYNGCTIRRDTLLADPQAYVNFLTGLKGPGHVVVALIGGDPSTTITTGELKFGSATQPMALQPSCRATINGASSFARPANRLEDFRTSFGNLGLFATVCQPDYGQAVADIGTLLFQAISPCLQGKVEMTDIDAAMPGLQLDCSVSDVQSGATETTQQVMPRCPMTDANTPNRGALPTCWWVKTDNSCGTETDLALQVERAAAPPPGTNVRVSCVGESD